jgi:hypothetical protein
MKNLLLLLTIFLFISCGEDDVSTTNTNNNTQEPSIPDTFNKADMLTNWADNIIIPAYTDFQSKLESLKVATTNFTASQSQEDLTELRSKYVSAYKTWQYVMMFSSIGKADELNINRWVNIYPTKNDLIESNIAASTTDLSLSSTNTQQGFPALDYLLYGVNNALVDGDDAIRTVYSSANYRNYLIAVVDRLSSLNQAVLDDWNGGYRNTFVQSTENTATSSVNIMANDYVYFYEKLFRTYKLGNPLAVFGGLVSSQEIESLYGKHSKELCIDALDAVENLFNGKHYANTTQGESFRSYLIFLDSRKDGEELVPVILNQIDIVRSNINLLDSDFAVSIDTNIETAYTTYDEIQRLVPILKVDMMQAFNIAGDYVDNDGD